ncbi:unnamed protein product [Brassicogethes aeneus]|uniref:Uncharacterized protein n=1 Tax=Brassicogethes aeneus TaxID=1431903 RepID=A0A9P0FKB6_BRAAE|nr:unnamed protein product [Brassicogethes aeneus]
MVIKAPKKGKKADKNENQESRNEGSKSDVMSDSLFTFLTNLAESLTFPNHKKVFFTIKQYKIKDIYPSHPNNTDDPTDILIFCLRWVAINKFQPIGGILFKPEEYTGVDSKLGKTLGELLKAYLWSINRLSLSVVAIVSPPDDYFKSIIRYLTKGQDFETSENPILFFSEQFNNIPCVYDPEIVHMNFQNRFCQNDVAYFQNNMKKSATWKNIELLLNLDEFEGFKNKNLFTGDVYNYLLANITNEKFIDIQGTANLVSSLRIFIKYLEIDSFSISKLSELYFDWIFVLELLETMEFKEKSTEINPEPKSLFKISLLTNEIKKVEDTKKPDESENKFTIKKIADDKNNLLSLKSEKENINLKKEKNKPYTRKSKKKKSKSSITKVDSELETPNSKTKLLSDINRNFGTLKEEKSPRSKNSPYSRPQKEIKHSHSPPVKLVDNKVFNLPKIEEDLTSLLESVKEQISSWSDDDSFESSSEKSSSSEKTKKTHKPYSRPEINESTSELTSSLNISLKECTNLINKMKIERPDATPKVTNKDSPILEYKSAIKSMKFAVNKLVDYKTYDFFMSAFNCKHTDYYVNIIKKDINQLPVPDDYITNPLCTLHNKTQAILTLDKESGNLFCLKQ